MFTEKIRKYTKKQNRNRHSKIIWYGQLYCIDFANHHHSLLQFSRVKIDFL